VKNVVVLAMAASAVHAMELDISQKNALAAMVQNKKFALSVTVLTSNMP